MTDFMTSISFSSATVSDCCGIHVERRLESDLQTTLKGVNLENDALNKHNKKKVP